MRGRAQAARAELREGRLLSDSLDANTLPYNRLNDRQLRLVDEYNSRALHQKVDAANKEYGHGVARTHDYGFAPGEQMCRVETITQRTAAVLQLVLVHGVTHRPPSW